MGTCQVALLASGASSTVSSQGLQGCWAPPERERNEILKSAGTRVQEIIQTSKQESQIIFFPFGSIWSNFWFVPRNYLSKASLYESADTA